MLRLAVTEEGHINAALKAITDIAGEATLKPASTSHGCGDGILQNGERQVTKWLVNAGES